MGTWLDMSDLSRATMNAYIPPLQSAIRTGGEGGRVTFEIPESDIGEFAKLLAMRGKKLRVTVEVVDKVNVEIVYGGRLKDG